jgi:ABC-type glycerol-3-phosphate transport system substrate-binding protein
MMRTAISLLLSLTLVAACGGREKTASTATPAQASASAAVNLTPEQLGELGAQIQKNPDRAQELLKHHGFTPESFEVAIRKVTENPDASRRYAAAYRRASA